MTAAALDVDLDEYYIIVFGPASVDEVTVHEVDVLLDQLEDGVRRVVADEDVDPRLI